jgi:hypothetical protein
VTTSAVTSSTTTSSLSTTSSTSVNSSTSTKSGGGVPVFPYQLPLAAIFTVVLVASYLLVRRRAPSRGSPI